MAAYNPPDQILFSPVTNYYQGKALRADTALREKQAKALQMEMDAAPAKAAAAQREEQRKEEKHKADMAKADRDVEESLRELGEARTDDLAEASASGFLAFDEGATDEEATERFFAPLYASPNFTPEQVDQIRSSLDKDGNAVISKKEAESLKNFGMAYALRKEQQKKIVAGDEDSGGGPSSLFAKPSIKDFTPESIQKYGETENPADLVPRPEEEKPSERDKRLRDVMELGSSKEEAIDLVDKYIKVTSSTDSMGNVTVTNTRTKKSYKISARKARAAGLDVPKSSDDIEKTDGYVGPGWAKPIALISPAPNLQNTIITESQRSMQEIDKGLMAGGLISGQDVIDAAGVANMAQRGINNMAQVASLNTLPRWFQTETDARLKVLNFNQAVRSAVVVSSKGAIWEQQKVEQMLPNPDSLLEDPVGAGIAYTRTMHWLMNQREADVALLEGRPAVQIPRVPLGVEDDPIIVNSQEEAEEYPPGTWVMWNGKIGEVN